MVQESQTNNSNIACETYGFNVKIILKLTDFDQKQAEKTFLILDQAHTTLDTSIHKVMLLLNNPIVFKQKILFLGDDDLTSLALMMAFKKPGHYCKNNIYVKDIDKELLEFIREVSKENNFIINTEFVDLKHSNKYAKSFDVILTDPPYTFDGLKLFLS
ncbi:bis-aminopropyl spermidine synthase family protein [Xenorhabdus budapestensis]|uniref:S-adenosylmethionine decarboxylase proenzyme n=1 Tax=Xenorhabdus budapestensis TaxID=290110 RepID=A0A2D0J118_XENBU|nr:bis-aminopropyl spermidine synthase family protein [Xenorhabdus budapestensis]PHM28014.1 S-adenosylmethionine decarboxylase proenzyme [Xenorhabdus budapestensis]